MSELPLPTSKGGGRSVSISEERQFGVSAVYRFEDSESEANERKESSSSFLMPAVNLARRLSMRIAGNRDGAQLRRRKRRATRPEIRTLNNGRRKSIFEGRSSVAQLSLDVERGVIIIKEEKLNPIFSILSVGVRRVCELLGLSHGTNLADQPPEQETIALQQIEPPHRYRPNSIKQLCNITGFSEEELKRLYRGFKTECPTGVVDEENFHNIYTHLFPWGEENYHANICSYSHYVFSLLDEAGRGVITFEEFVLCLSLIFHGTEEDKIRWTFRLYDLNGDGVIQKDEMQDVALAIFDLMGKLENDNTAQSEKIFDKVGDIFEIMDTNEDGVISLEEFMSYNISEGLVRNSEPALAAFR